MRSALDQAIHNALIADGLKRCSRCRLVKHVGCFSHYARSSDGFNSWCAACKAAQHQATRERSLEGMKAYRIGNAERLREQKRRWDEANRERLLAHKRQYYLDHKGEHLGRMRAWAKSHPERARAIKRAYTERHPDRVKAHDEAAKTLEGRARRRLRYVKAIERQREQKRHDYERHRERRKAAVAAFRLNNPDKVRESNRKTIAKRPEYYRELARVRRHRWRAHIRRNGGSWSGFDWQRLKAQYGWACAACGRCEPDIKLTFDHNIPVSRGGWNIISNGIPLCAHCNSSKGSRTFAEFRALLKREQLTNK